MQRRQFLAGGAGAIAGLVVGEYGGLLGRLGLPGSPASASEVLLLDTWLAGLDGLGELGERRLALAGEAPTTAGAAGGTQPAPGGDSLALAGRSDSLARALGARLRVDVGRPVRVDVLEERLRAAVAEDYRERRLCEVDGWQLAEIECQLAELRVVRLRAAEPAPASFREAQIVAVEGWGPRSTDVGTPFNVQRDGHSGLWFRAPGAPRWLQVVVDGDPMPTFVNGDVVTSGLHGETMERVLATAGRYAVVFRDEIGRVEQTVGHLEVRPAARPAALASGRASAAFCVVEAWGPRATAAGVAVNRQADGSIGLWLRTGCAPPRARLRADGRDLETTVRKDGRVTAKLPPALIERPGAIELTLHDPASGESVPVGRFVVRGTAGG